MDPVTAVFILLLFFGLLRRRRQKKMVVEQTIMPTGVYPYLRKKILLNKHEQHLLTLLKAAVGQQYVIFLQVSMGALMDVNKNISASARPGYLKKINAQPANFVLCKPDNLSVSCIILLQNHQDFLEKACEAADLTLLYFKPAYTYNQQEVIDILHFEKII